MYNHVYLCLPLFTCACLPMFSTFTPECLPMFTHVYSCLLMCTLVYLRLYLFVYVYPCLPMLPMFTHACLPF